MFSLFRKKPQPMGLPVANAQDPYWLQRYERRRWLQARGIPQPRRLWGARHGHC